MARRPKIEIGPYMAIVFGICGPDAQSLWDESAQDWYPFAKNFMRHADKGLHGEWVGIGVVGLPGCGLKPENGERCAFAHGPVSEIKTHFAKPIAEARKRWNAFRRQAKEYAGLDLPAGWLMLVFDYGRWTAETEQPAIAD